MNKRWRQGLGELDTVEPSPDVWDRAVARSVEGPTVDIPAEFRRRILAGVVAVVVAGRGLAGAFLALRGLGARPTAGDLATYRDPNGAWEISYPERFRQGAIPKPAQPRGFFEGIWIANFDPPPPPDDAGGPLSSLSFEVPDDGVIVLVYQRFRGPFFIPREPDSAFPISFDDLKAERGLYQGAYLTDSVLANGEPYTITVRWGPDATRVDQDAAADIVSSLRFLPLEEGTATGRELTFYVLGPPDRYPVGSVTRFDRSNLPASEDAEPLSFYLVHVPEGFYALAWPANLVGGYQNCEVTYDPVARGFACPNGASWALDGSVVAKPDPGVPDDPLSVLLVRISLDGHVLVSPNVFQSDPELDLRMTAG